MTATMPSPATEFHGADACRDTEVLEVPLLLPAWQVDALEEAAHARGMTAASMVRKLVSDLVVNWMPALK